MTTATRADSERLHGVSRQGTCAAAHSQPSVPRAPALGKQLEGKGAEQRGRRGLQVPEVAASDKSPAERTLGWTARADSVAQEGSGEGGALHVSNQKASEQ